MLLTFDETCERLRELVSDHQLFGWNWRDCCMAGHVVYTICFNPGNKPQVEEWSQAQVERWLRKRNQFEGIIDGS